MAFTDPIVLADQLAANQTFTQTGMSKDGSYWIENDATGTDQRKLAILHSNAGASLIKGGPPARRHLFQIQHAKWNSTLGKTELATLNTTLTLDPTSSFSTANLYDLAAFLRNFYTSGNLDKLIRNEA
jgi:hypothetical protein